MSISCLLLAHVFIVTSLARADEQGQRVLPPRWSKDVLDAFFDDAHQQLVGERPTQADLAKLQQAPAQQPGNISVPTSSASKWSSLISGETLTAEVKRINNQLAKVLEKPANFQSGGNARCRRDFGLLSLLFGIIADFDEDVRWQRSATIMREICFQAGQNCKAASAQSYAAAESAQLVLVDLIRGQAPSADSESSSEDEPELVDFVLLMQAMEVAQQERISPTLSNVREFRKRSHSAFEQAQLMAVMAKVIQQEGYDYFDDDTFIDEARQLQKASQELAEAAQEKNYEAARAAAGRVSQSCSRCHEDYRG